MTLFSPFNSKARRYNNGDAPFILVDLYTDDPARGDSHGYIGLATRVAEQTGGRVSVIDDQSLKLAYPDHPEGLYGHQLRLMDLFNKEGCPDFFFARHAHAEALNYLSKNGSGVHVSSINEYLRPGFWTRVRHTFNPLVPHHLTQTKLYCEGHRFAEEFQELPRPFIGVIYLDGGEDLLMERFSRLRDAYKEATIFLCSAWRTPDVTFERMEKELKACLGSASDRFPVIPFNYSRDLEFLDRDATWNVYPGLLDQADHLFLLGYSESISAEILATGKSFYKHDDSRKYSPNVRKLEDYVPGTKIETKRFKPIDISDDVAAEIVAAQKEQASKGTFGHFVNKIRGKAGKPRGYRRI